jgi:two-component system sensor histidine kinase DesK
MTTGPPATPGEAEWVAHQRRWSRGWRQLVFPAIVLIYLLYVASAVGDNTSGAATVWGDVLLGVFALGYLAILPTAEKAAPARFWVSYGALAALTAAQLPFSHAGGFVLCLYLTIITVIRLGTRSVLPVVFMALAATIVPVIVPAWHDTLAESLAAVTPVAIPVVAISVYGFRQMMRGNIALAQARAEIAILAAENERSRIARDLHDLLGHSLTTITVKAGLAARIGGTDLDRALREMSEVEILARRSLTDVRAAVSNYNDVTLTGELANGRELLRAAGITADLPRATDVVDPSHQELFGWVVREGFTNIVRHAHASSCAVRLSPSSVEIVDDGVGTPAGPAAGNGLSGLRERVTAAGGVIDAGPLQPQGWRLCVSVAGAGATA